MKKLSSSFSLAYGMLTLGLLILLALPGCDDPLPGPVSPSVLGCTDRQAVNYNPAATVSDGSCNYASDKLPGTYSITSMECSSNYNGYLSGVETIMISPYTAYAFLSELVTVTFPNPPVSVFGTGRVDGNRLRVLNTRLSADADYIELKATLNNGILSGEFVITDADRPDGGYYKVCAFVATKN